MSDELYLSLLGIESHDVLLDYCLENNLIMPCGYPFTCWGSWDSQTSSVSSSDSYQQSYVVYTWAVSAWVACISCSGTNNNWRVDHSRR